MSTVTETIRKYAKVIPVIIMFIYNVARMFGVEIPISEESTLDLISPQNIDILINLLLSFSVYQVRNGPKVEESPDPKKPQEI